jgi:hypothetical protein
MKKIIFLAVILALIALVCIIERDDSPMEKSLESERAQKLADPELLYFSSNWSGLCSNGQGDQGGCYEENYLYSSGLFIKKTGFVLGAETESTSTEKKISDSEVAAIVKKIKNSSLSNSDCPDTTILDAGWDYQINIDGTKTSFHNPSEECKNLFDGIDELVDSISRTAETSHDINNSQIEGYLGGQNCLSKFHLTSDEQYAGEPEILGLEFFRSFGGGAFFGVIKNYNSRMSSQFAYFINQLMQEKRIKTYSHLSADICLYNQDLLNPQGGATLGYYIEHYYCTNSCQTGKYELRVDLDSEGNFVGYRVTYK